LSKPESISQQADSLQEEASPESESQYGREWAGSLPEFPQYVGHDLTHSYELQGFRSKRLLFGRLERPGDVHVYSVDCHAGARLRAQILVPVLPLGGGLAPAFAVVAQSLPYSADAQRLPLKLPAGYSAVVAHPPVELVSPVQDRLTKAQYYPGPVVDTRTLVSGRCYFVVWSPDRHMGKYVLQIGHLWPLSWLYWLRTPLFWWRIRGWYGLSRAKAYVAAATALVVLGFVVRLARRGGRTT
jgi:hypothetical protein